MNDKGRNNYSMKNIPRKKILKYIRNISLIILLCAAAGFISVLAYSRANTTETKPTKLGFENIGELATQVAYCTEVNSIAASRKLFNITIPFTESTNIYSYDITIKAGFDFTEIKWTSDEATKTILVTLPEIRILSSEIDPSSFKLYYESESVFRPISLNENNDALASMKEDAEQNAISNGLLVNAEINAKTIITQFFSNSDYYGQYQINFN